MWGTSFDPHDKFKHATYGGAKAQRAISVKVTELVSEGAIRAPSS